MKNFKQLKESLYEAKKIKVGKVTVEIKKVGSKYQAIVDGDLLDTYSSEREAIKMAKELVKQL